jgi:hypothetical protein
MKPKRRSRGLRRAIPRRAPCAFPLAAVRPAYNAKDRRGAERGRHCLDRGDRPAQRCRSGGADGRRHRSPLWQGARSTPGRHKLRHERRTSLRWPLTSGGRLRSIRRRRAKGTTSNWPVWRGAVASERRSPPASRRGGNGWRARRARLSRLWAKRIEPINADRKNHGFGFLPVGGLIKAKAHALWHALANNLMAARRLRANAA